MKLIAVETFISMVINPSVVEARRIFGTGIVLTGVVILAIGLIFGLEFPKYIHERRLSRLCITSTSSRDFRDWIVNSNRTPYNYLRIWNLTNIDEVLYRNESPKFQLLGPYVFRERERKIQVRFYNGLVDYKSWKQQEFQADMTRLLCPCCSLNDSVTLINPAFLQLIDAHDSPLNYYLSLIPQLINNTAINITDQFDKWIFRADTDFKRVIITDKQRQNQAPSMHVKIKQVLGNSAVFGEDILLKKGQWNNCKTYYRRFSLPISEGQILSISNTVNAVSNDIVQLNTTLNIINTINRLLNDSSINGSNKSRQKQQEQQKPFVPKCGLAFYLMQLAATSLVNWMLIKPILSSFLCHGNNGSSCILDDVTQSNGTNISTAYMTALVYYTVDYLPRHLLMPQSRSITISSSDVESVALGYYVEANSLRPLKQDVSSSRKELNIRHVKGFLDHYETEEEAEQYSPLITLKTCLLNRSRDNNLIYKAVDGNQGATSASGNRHYDHDSLSKVVIDGYQDYKIPPSNLIYPCGTSQPFYESFRMYLPQLWTSGAFTLDTSTQYKSVVLHRFRSKLGSEDDLMSTSNVTGYLSWVSASGFKPDSNLTSKYRHMMNTTSENRIQPEVLVEPVTGQIWITSSSVSVYVGFKLNFFNVSWSNTTYRMVHLTEKPHPLYSLYTTTEPSQTTVNLYNTEIRVLLQMSCGGLIGLSIVGSVIILTGIGVAMAVVDSRPPHRVTPAQQLNNHFNINSASSEINIYEPS